MNQRSSLIFGACDSAVNLYKSCCFSLDRMSAALSLSLSLSLSPIFLFFSCLFVHSDFLNDKISFSFFPAFLLSRKFHFFRNGKLEAKKPKDEKRRWDEMTKLRKQLRDRERRSTTRPP